MSDRPRVVILLARCRHSKTSFGIRLEEKRPAEWGADWAFPIQERSAAREGYDRTHIAGSFTVDPAYPGCSHCEAKGYFKCCCGKVACWDGQESPAVCPWCGEIVEISGFIDNLIAGSDR